MEYYPGLSWLADIITRILIRKSQKESESERRQRGNRSVKECQRDP